MDHMDVEVEVLEVEVLEGNNLPSQSYSERIVFFVFGDRVTRDQAVYYFTVATVISQFVNMSLLIDFVVSVPRCCGYIGITANIAFIICGMFFSLLDFVHLLWMRRITVGHYIADTGYDSVLFLVLLLQLTQNGYSSDSTDILSLFSGVVGVFFFVDNISSGYLKKYMNVCSSDKKECCPDYNIIWNCLRCCGCLPLIFMLEILVLIGVCVVAIVGLVTPTPTVAFVDSLWQVTHHADTVCDEYTYTSSFTAFDGGLVTEYCQYNGYGFTDDGNEVCCTWDIKP